MAKELVSCTGDRFKVGDKVRTPDGKVIRIGGGAIAAAFYNAEGCTCVHADTPTTREAEDAKVHEANKHSGGDYIKPVRGGAPVELDCIVWGG